MSPKILIADDHPFTRAGIRAILKTDKTIEVVGEAVDGKDAIKKVGETKPEIVVMDINMPNLSGIEATIEILKASPEIKIIVLSIHSSEKYVKKMLAAGAVGYLLKDEAPDELLLAVEKVGKGEMFLSSAVTRTALSKTKKEETFVNINILQTKIHRPPVMDDYVIREKIIEKLENNIYRPLSIISAGAGYGKSVTVSEWLDKTRFPHTWLSLDEEHNDFQTFLFYLCAAIEKVFPDSLNNTGNLLSAGNLPPFEVISNSLINELSDIDQDFILVLDDYHLIREKKIHQLINKWLRFPPQNIHLSIVTRRDPPLNIKPLRANDRLTEIRMTDLSFSDKEIASLFKKLLGTDLSDQAIAKLREKTEGWIIGLRMALLTVNNKDDIDRLLAVIEGGFHQISNYLIPEVLSKLPQQIQDQLIDSSILNRFCAELIEAIMITGNKTEHPVNDADHLIQWMIKSNMFVIQLDNKQKWFRYHHLFQNLLQNQLKKHRTIKHINTIYNKASIWFEKNDYIAEAIKYTMQANNTERAVEIIVTHWENTIDKDLWYIVEGWMNLLPEKVIVKSVSLLLARMWTTMQRLRIEDIPVLIELIEKRSEDLTDTETGYLAHAKSVICYLMGDAQNALDHSKLALKLIPKKHFCMRGDIKAWQIVEMQSLGMGDIGIEMAKEELTKVYPDDYRQLMRLVLRPNFVYIIDANLPALKTGIESLLKIPIFSPYILGFGLYFRACISWWGYNHEKAVKKFDDLINIRFQTTVRLGIDSYICTALSLQELNRHQNVTDVINRATQFAMEIDDTATTSILASGRARLNLKQGNLEAAEEWLNSAEHSGIDPTMLYWVEIPAITQCRVLIAMATPDSLNKALELLKGYRKYSESISHKLRTIETTVLQAQTYFKLQNESEAIEALKYALEIAAKGEWIRPFIEDGKELQDLYLTLKEKGVQPDFVENILTKIKNTFDVLSEVSTIKLKKSVRPRQEQSTPLTRKEIEVLLLIAKGYRNREIAYKLFNSEQTIKKHISNMFQKLNVHNRLNMVSKARELEMLEAQE